MAEFTNQQLETALQEAMRQGNKELATEIARVIDQRMKAGEPDREGGNMLANVAKGAGRGVTGVAGMAGDIGDITQMAPKPDETQGLIKESLYAMIRNNPVSRLLSKAPNTQEVRAAADKAVDMVGGKEGESVFTGGEDTYAGRIGEFLGGNIAFGAPAIGRQVAREGIKSLAKYARKMAASNVMAGAGSRLGEDMYGTPGSIVGALVPGAALGAAKAATRATLRGIGKENQMEMRKAIDDVYSQINPARDPKGPAATLGTVTPKSSIQALAGGWEAIPGVHGVVLKNADLNANALAKRLQTILQTQGLSIAEDKAGLLIASGAKNRLGEITRRSSKLYDRANALVTNGNSMVNIKPLQAALKELTQKQGVAFYDDVLNAVKAEDDVAAKLLERLNVVNKTSSKGVLQYANYPAGATVASTVALPWQFVNTVRRAVGKQIQLNKVVGNQDQGALKQLYKTLAKALEDGADAAGGPQLSRAIKKANWYWSKQRPVIDKILSPVIKQEVLPESLYRKAVGTTLKNTSILKQSMRGLTPEQREYVAKAFVAKLGNVDDSTGAIKMELWSPGRMLSNWDKLPGNAKDILFNSKDLRVLRKELDRFFNVLRRQQKTSDALANPSGTAGRGLMAATGMSVLANMGKIAGLGLLGSVGGATGAMATIGSAVAGANMGARLMHNPRFISWLADGMSIADAKIPQHVARLAVIAANETDPEQVQALMAFNEGLRRELRGK